MADYAFSNKSDTGRNKIALVTPVLLLSPL